VVEAETALQDEITKRDALQARADRAETLEAEATEAADTKHSLLREVKFVKIYSILNVSNLILY
jgi:hypothetical protein